MCQTNSSLGSQVLIGDRWTSLLIGRIARPTTAPEYLLFGKTVNNVATANSSSLLGGGLYADSCTEEAVVYIEQQSRVSLMCNEKKTWEHTFDVVPTSSYYVVRDATYRRHTGWATLTNLANWLTPSFVNAMALEDPNGLVIGSSTGTSLSSRCCQANNGASQSACLAPPGFIILATTTWQNLYDAWVAYYTGLGLNSPGTVPVFEYKAGCECVLVVATPTILPITEQLVTDMSEILCTDSSSTCCG